MLVTHMTEVNDKFTDPHNSTRFGSVSLALFSILNKNVDDDKATKTDEVYIGSDGCKNVGVVA